MARVVLLVEDDNDILQLYRTAFTVAGFETIEAVNGADAMEKLDQRLPDAVVLDISMPKASGLRVIEYLREERGMTELPVIVTTAYPYLAEATVLSGATHTLMKPMAIQKLVNLVESLMVDEPV